MVTPDPFVAELIRLVGEEAVIWHRDRLVAYDCDAFTIARAIPRAVVLPTSTEQVVAVVRLAWAHGMPIVPRGSGTGLAGGTLCGPDCLMICTSRMNRILALESANRRALVEAGVVNLALGQAAEPFGLAYAPDPSSQMACTVGGNVANNSGGPHTLKYGVTTNHVLGLELVLPDGEVVWLGGEEERDGYDLVGLVVGSEGTFGIVTRVLVRLIPLPQSVITLLAVYQSVEAASESVSDIIGAGMLPAALEMMDQVVIRAVEEAFHFGFPLDAAAVLIIELDGPEPGLAGQAQAVEAICRARGAREIRQARDQAERALLWKSRKRAIGALGRYAPSHATQDGVIPRSKLPEVLAEIARIARTHRLLIANVFHAGDGNLHPVVLFDDRDSEQVQRVLAAGSQILAKCVAVGGSISGEHGIGIEKLEAMSLMFSLEDLALMRSLRALFDPLGRINPGKALPTGQGCGETRVKVSGTGHVR